MRSEAAEQYGQGLLELAQENHTVEEKKDQAEKLLNLLKAMPEIELFFRSVKITEEEKHDFIDKAFGMFVDHDMVSFCKLLVDKGRITILRDALKEYVHRAEELLGIARAEVQSARPLDQESLDQIQKTLEKQYNRKFVLKTVINPDLIAGFRVITENHVTDVTMARKIDDLHKALLKGGQA